MGNIKHCVILIMSTSSRLTSEKIQSLTGICDTTYICKNKGYKNCQKPKYVDSPTADLLYTMKYIFEKFAYLKAPLLVLEDDAVIVGKKDDFKSVDTFVATNDFNRLFDGLVRPFSFLAASEAIRDTESSCILWDSHKQSYTHIKLESRYCNISISNHTNYTLMST